jgi:hypothetical protein
MATDNPEREAGSEWRAIVGKNSTREFAAAFAANPVLEASVLNRPMVGIGAIDAFFAATARDMYDSLRFTTETVDGRKTYLEWEGRVSRLRSTPRLTAVTSNEPDIMGTAHRFCFGR